MLLIKNATVIDSKSTFNGKQVDILIEKGIIKKIGKKISPEKKCQIISYDNLHVSPGWVDMRANFRDPGHEYKENLASGLEAAKKGGFTDVVLNPETEPCIDSKADIEYLINKAKGSGVNVLPMGTLSKEMKGNSLAEMYDMKLAGALAFSDNKHSVSADLMTKALLYTKNFNGLVVRHASNRQMNGDGMMHEGEVSTRLGLKGMPSLAEDIEVGRDLELLAYTESKIHFSLTTSANAIEKIRQAKKSKLNVSADISPLYLFFSDKNLVEYDTNFKLFPPLRSAEHQKAIIKGLKDGTIDIICSDHEPEDVENKRREFEYAAFGAASIEHTFATAWTSLQKHLNLAELVDKFTHNPRKILALPELSIQENAKASLTLFNPETSYQVSESDSKSLGVNNPLVGFTLKGVVYEIIN
jgi:dihydroorotase